MLLVLYLEDNGMSIKTGQHVLELDDTTTVNKSARTTTGQPEL